MVAYRASSPPVGNHRHSKLPVLQSIYLPVKVKPFYLTKPIEERVNGEDKTLRNAAKLALQNIKSSSKSVLRKRSAHFGMNF
jgi:hypothetical protein